MSKTAIEWVQGFRIDNEHRHRIISKRIDNLDHALYHLEEDIDEIFDDLDDSSSDSTSDEGSVNLDPEHVTV